MHRAPMRITHSSYVTGSIFTLAVGGLALTGCGMADPTTDQINEEFDGTIEHPTMQACGGGNFACKAHVVLDENNRIRPFALPAGLGPADLTSAYKLNPAITSTATISRSATITGHGSRSSKPMTGSAFMPITSPSITRRRSAWRRARACFCPRSRNARGGFASAPWSTPCRSTIRCA